MRVAGLGDFLRFAVCVAWMVAGPACSDDGVSDDVAEDGSEGDGDGGDGNDGADGSNDGVDDGSGGQTGDDGVDDGADGATDSADDSPDSADGTADGADDGGAGLACLNDQFVNGPSPGPDYTMFDIEVGSHCQGTNNQDITDIERIVFLGDSVSVGTPPTPGAQTYRALVANGLATMFGLEPPSADWMNYNILNGNPITAEEGAFAWCAEWGARNDDLMSQLEACFPNPEDFDYRTLLVWTSGGNDIAAMTKDAIDGVPAGDLFEQLEMMVDHHRMTLEWIKEDGRFPNGVFVVNANVFEFTDYTAEVTSCPTSAIAGFNGNPPNTMLLLSSLNLINEEYTQAAIDYGTDMVFMFEGMCGHGFKASDSANVCYRGDGAANHFDASCIHPTVAGHSYVADMFLDVIGE